MTSAEEKDPDKLIAGEAKYWPENWEYEKEPDG